MPWATLLAAITLAAAVAGADATSFAVAERPLYTTMNPIVFEAAGAQVRCPITLSGSFTESTFAKTTGLRVGSITSGTLGECSGGTATLVREALPWSVQYTSFAGTLPNITSTALRLIGATLTITPTGGPTCTARTEAGEPLPSTATRNNIGEITTLRMDETAGIRMTPFLCEITRGHVGGTGTVSREGRTAGVILLLRAGSTTSGTALEGNTEGEREAENPIAKLVIPAARTESTRAVRNRSSLPIVISGISLAGENSESFSLPSARESPCRVGTILQPNSESCNVAVSVTGSPRPFRSTVNVTYTWDRGTVSSTQSFSVVAESR
ncbi:MAG: hypothetical protein JSS99_07055 [Actinobacteria bacterium]|nr:hypothetical protein [Actinomycetota bacterium]